ncbi:hypothetical protein M9Y10_006200 [Tritrichomonas musculus]|uniref:RNA helicase n=1 Tax=Tritrichomonas musculus TaxID=1915356 RepID=A0ABR2JEJ6_9EUKA
MDDQSKNYLEKLFKDRMDSADTLDKPSMRGVQRTVVEKYSDQAHFIYELLQNADDAEATKASFDLYKDKLVFKHNGKRHFSVSNPLTEDEDSKRGTLGDINSITSIANSNKTEAKIGKFGIGFKAVFQYTSTPIIYDPNFRFRIERFIVPVIINEDYEGRKADETVFIFPFNHKVKSAKDAYEDISEKLCSLTYPLLFLKTMNEVDLFIENRPLGKYSKNIVNRFHFGDIDCEYICLTNIHQGKSVDSNLWLFTKSIFSLNISVGFFVNDKGQLTPVHEFAFCFFPTKEITNLNFIIQAPFLLTDSREGIKSKEAHNLKMINELSKLSARSILLLKQIGNKLNIRLIDDNILSIIPINESVFDDYQNINKISFKPFYTAIKNAFLREEIIPTFDGYVSKENAFFATTKNLMDLFSNDQLAILTHNSEAKWSFTTISLSNNMHISYIKMITNTSLDDETFLKNENFLISSNFISKQSFEWLHKFYKWINLADRRVNMIRTLPIFINQHGKAVAAFDKQNHLILFLPFEGNTIYSTVHERLLENAETKNFILRIGITGPSMKDEINNIILPKYKKGGPIDSTLDFKKFFNHYKECSQNEVDSFIDLIKEIPFVMCISNDGNKSIKNAFATSVYFPSPTLFEYFQTKPGTLFILIDEYKKLVPKEEEKSLIDFFKKVGVSKKVRLVDVQISLSDATNYKIAIPKHTRYIEFYEKHPDGFDEIMRSIKTSPTNSIKLWNLLIKMSKKETLKKIDVGLCKYFYYKPKQEVFISSFKIRLQTEKWLLNSKKQLVSADQIFVDELASHYDVKHIGFNSLVNFLNIKERKLDDVLTEQQMSDLEFVQTLKEKGLMESAKKMISEKEVENIQSRSVDIDFDKKSMNSFNDDDDDDESDGVIKPASRNRSKLNLEIHKSKAELQRINQLNSLQKIADKSVKYSFLWFKTLLQMESIENGFSENDSKRGISIIFEKVQLEQGKTQTLILKHPNRHIPIYLEDLSNILLTLLYSSQFKTFSVDIINVESFSIKVKLNSPLELNGIDLNKIEYARIEAADPIFLLEELLKSFNELNFDDDFNLFQNLSQNIEFIFGPPGTGKTTHLAQKVIIPLMQAEEDYKVLVLAPTNKAADIVVKRLFESGRSCIEWLVRFGTSSDESEEVVSVYKKKTFDIRTMIRNVVVTTIARFPYYSFTPGDHSQINLKDIEWDFIVFDESSMIPLINVIYPLFKGKPKKFIVAGDPFQIQPIVTVDAWKNENIYSMVCLNSFSNPQTRPHPYHVELLTTEFRSVPSVGSIYSNLTYGGILNHFRSEVSKKELFIHDTFRVSTLNIIKFPVTEKDGICKSRRLQSKSSYHVYSALFVYKLIKFLIPKLTSKFTIGIISPYKAQVGIIDKLVSLLEVPENIAINIGTIHSFQGDECDVMFVVLNPPPTISESPDMFLNNINIINVSISRTRDCLFLLVPDGDTEYIEKLKLVKKVEKLCKQNPTCFEYSSHQIEEFICGDKNYLENNSTLSIHQPVNVYRHPEQNFEIFCDESAIDILVNE